MMHPLAEQMIFQALGGLGLFMLGMHFLSDGLRTLAAARMRAIMERLARNRLTGLLTSAFATAVVQSSTLITVMIVGFVNSGIITLEQAIAMIMGANIGTTVTTILIALPIAQYGLPLVGVAALLYVFAPQERLQHLALTILGLGMIFFGISLLITGFRPLRDMPEVLAFIASFDAGSLLGILKCLLVGALLTAILHSSAAMNGIIIGMAATGVLNWQTSMAFVLGAEVGTTVTSLMAAATLNIHARRTSYAHFAFNLVGVLLAIAAFPLLTRFTAALVGGDPGLPKVVDGVTSYPLAPVAIAAFVTSFNLLSTLLMLPWIPLWARLLNRIGAGAAAAATDLAVPRFLFNKALEAPQAAIELLEKEQERYRQALPGLLDGICRPGRTDSRTLTSLRQSLDTLHEAISDFGERLCAREMSASATADVIHLVQMQETSAALTRRLTTLVETWNRHEPRGETQQVALRWIEALDALLGETLAALARRDSHHLAILREMTGNQGPNVENMRRRYLEYGERFTVQERKLLLTTLGKIEGCIWLLHRLCRAGIRESKVAATA